MQNHKILAPVLLLFTATPLLAAVPTKGGPLRVDINSEGRADMRTVGWHNWQPSDGDMSRSFGNMTATLRAVGEGGSVSLKGNKAIVIHGVTLGADAAVASGGKSPVMEVQLEGLAPGTHTFVGYHHALGGDAGTYTISAGKRKAKGIKPSKDARRNDEVGSSFIEFEAQADQPAVIRIAATDGERVLLSGFALDVADPRKKALKPLPADHERHADGDGGKANLTWTPSDSAVSQHVYMVSDLDPEAAERKLISATKDSEAFSSRGAKNITFQRNLISEALNIAGHKKYGKGSAHGFAGSIGGNVGSFHHSLLAHNAGRNWSLAGATDQANRHSGRIDIRNMVVYNWKHRTTDGGAKEVNFVNNYYKPGPATTTKTYLNPQFENPAFGPQQYYVEGNIMEGIAGPEGPTGPFKGMKSRGHQDAPATVPKPFFEHYVKTHSAKNAFENVLADVGCNVPMLDDHDKRVIEETRAGTTTYKGSNSGLPGLPDSQDDVGGWENYPTIHRPANWDADSDGMPNKWEIKRGLNPNDAMDGALDPNGDGYTNLEDYLNWLASGNTLS